MTTDSPHPPSADDPLLTRWSRLRGLHGEAADEAWRWFIARYAPAIRSLLRQVLPAHALPDAENEFWAYLFVSRAVARAAPDRRFRPYLAGIVRNFGRAFWRRSANAVGLTPGAEPMSLSAGAECEQEELRAWARNTLLLAMANLAASHPTQATVLRWFYGLPDGDRETEPLPVTEIARRTGRQIATVHQDLTRGRVRLRQCVERELRDQCGSTEDWRDEVLLILGTIEGQRPGLIPR